MAWLVGGVPGQVNPSREEKLPRGTFGLRVPFWDGYPPPPSFLEVRILKGLGSRITEVFILVDLKGDYCVDKVKRVPCGSRDRANR